MVMMLNGCQLPLERQACSSPASMNPLRSLLKPPPREQREQKERKEKRRRREGEAIVQYEERLEGEERESEERERLVDCLEVTPQLSLVLVTEKQHN